MNRSMNFKSENFHKNVRFVYLLLFLAVGSCAVQKPPTLIPFADGEFWVLGNDLVFTVRDTGQKIIVPRGFVTDFASVPRIFWTFFPKHGEYTRAAIVHDYLYWQQQCSREQADELFDIVMEDSDVDSTSRFTIYAAVRVWGDSSWQENAELREQGFVRVIPQRYMNFPVKTKWLNYREMIRQMMDDNEVGEAFPITTPPAYCHALQDKDSEAGETPAELAPETEEAPEVPDPLIQPSPESSIGA